MWENQKVQPACRASLHTDPVEPLWCKTSPTPYNHALCLLHKPLPISSPVWPKMELTSSCPCLVHISCSLHKAFPILISRQAEGALFLNWRSSGGGHAIPLQYSCQPTPVFLPGESHGQRSLAGYRPWAHEQLDMTEASEWASEFTEVTGVYKFSFSWALMAY